MRFKKRWVYKAIVWKFISAITGALVVLGLTGRYSTSWQYLAWYVPITLALFVANEYVFWRIKIRNRCRTCNGVGVGTRYDGSPSICPKCDGSGTKSKP